MIVGAVGPGGFLGWGVQREIRGAAQTPDENVADGISGVQFPAGGGLTPWAAQMLVDRTGAPEMPGVMIAVVAVVVLPVFWFMRETAPRVA